MFEDREDAGLRLCPKLKKFLNKKDCVVVGLTRGGIVTSKKVSSLLNLPLKALVVKKIGAPQNPQLAIGAIVSLQDTYLGYFLLKSFNLTKEERQVLALQKLREVKNIILATPVIAADTLVNIKKYFDTVVYLEKRTDFYAVGQFYYNFEEISDEKVAIILATSH